MSYIGNTPTTVAFLTDQFSGNGSTTVFTMSVAPATTSSILVAITGVVQDPSTYAVSGTTLTFSAAPPTGTGNISVRYLGIPASGVATTAYRTVTEFTATAGQTTFSVPSYTIGYINVYRNGVMLGSADYTASSGTTVVLASGATAGDLITTESFYVSSVLNAIPATAGAVNSTYIADNSITTTKIAPGAVVQADLAANVAGNGPAFSVYRNANQTVSAAVSTKVAFNTKVYDTSNAFDATTNYRFQPTVAGYYQISAGTTQPNASSSAYIEIDLIATSGGKSGAASVGVTGVLYPRSVVSALIYLNGSTDYVEAYVYGANGSSSFNVLAGADQTWMTGYLARAA